MHDPKARTKIRLVHITLDLYSRVPGYYSCRRRMVYSSLHKLLLCLLLLYPGGGMDCVTALYAGVAGSSPTGKEQKFVPFSFIHNPPLSLFTIATSSSKRINDTARNKN